MRGCRVRGNRILPSPTNTKITDGDTCQKNYSVFVPMFLLGLVSDSEVDLACSGFYFLFLVIS